jgi:RNA polymerase sigma-70 factor (ECF subfamily)
MKECSTALPHPAVCPDRRSGLLGDAAAIELRRRLLGYAVKFVWNREDAEEIVQEAFTLALVAARAFPEDRLAAWMFRTVGNLSQNLRRRHKPEPLAPWLVIGRDTGPSERLERAEEFERLRWSVDQLPERQRTAIVLRMMEQMEYPRIAEIMELSVSAVRTHVHLARERLIEILTGEPASRREDRP